LVQIKCGLVGCGSLDLEASLPSWRKAYGVTYTFGNVRKEIRNLKSELEVLRNQPHQVGPCQVEIKIYEKLVELYHREEIM
jgi:hypothetical protein